MMSFFRKTLLKIAKRRAFKLINGRYAGKENFKTKARLLRKAGYEIGENTKIVGPIFCSASLSIGDDCWIGKNASFEGNGKISIGNNCDIAPNCVFTTGSHKIGDKQRRAGEGITSNIMIGNGNWICNSVIILAGVTLGNGNVIAAGSVIKDSFGDNALIAGVPGKEKKKYE